MNKLALTVEPLFISKAMLNELTMPVIMPVINEGNAKSKSVKALTYNDMVKSITGNTGIDKAWLMHSVNQSLPLRSAYKKLLQQLSFSCSEQQVAASSDEEFASRSTDYFTVDFKRDKTFKQQVYVLLSIINPLARHINQPIELHIVDENSVNQLSFSALVDGKSQQILDIDDTSMVSLLNSNSELFIY